MLLKIQPDAQFKPVQFAVSFKMPSGSNRERVKLLGPMKLASCLTHLRSEGYQWMGELGYPKPYSRTRLSGPHPYVDAGDGEVTPGAFVTTEQEWETWRIHAWFLYQIRSFTYEQAELDAIDIDIKRGFDEADGIPKEHRRW